MHPPSRWAHPTPPPVSPASPRCRPPLLPAARAAAAPASSRARPSSTSPAGRDPSSSSARPPGGWVRPAAGGPSSEMSLAPASLPSSRHPASTHPASPLRTRSSASRWIRAAATAGLQPAKSAPAHPGWRQPSTTSALRSLSRSEPPRSRRSNSSGPTVRGSATLWPARATGVDWCSSRCTTRAPARRSTAPSSGSSTTGAPSATSSARLPLPISKIPVDSGDIEKLR